MASILNIHGRKAILLSLAPDAPRRSIGLGRISDARAQTILGHVEELLGHRENKQPLARSTRGWVADLAEDRGRLYPPAREVSHPQAVSAPAEEGQR